MRMVLLAVLCSTFTAGQIHPAFNLMPQPANLQLGTGELAVTRAFSVAITGRTELRLQRATDLFLTDLRKATGMLPTSDQISDPSKATLVIHVDNASKDVQELGEDESYTLEVTSNSATLNAVTVLGAMRGLQTLLQLVNIGPTGFTIPAVTIKDQPRFPWRGLMIDVSRHFIPLDILKRNLDGMAAVKLNVLHWHLSDNQGFRVESKRFPKLQQMGSDDQYYSQDEVRDLIAYARDRGIRVVPEFDMPGHSTAWFVGYPELASAPGPYGIERHWGIFDPAMDPTEDTTYKFLDSFIGEMAKLFPDQYFHIGGDEVNGKQWSANPKIQTFMKSHGIKDNPALQAYFTRRVQEIVHKHGKIMEGWDEILQPDTPKDVIIQSWRGQDSLASAAKMGYSGLLSFGYYLDLQWPASRHYAIDPMPAASANLSKEEQQHILGGEACMWSEYISPEIIDSRIWPRMAAIAERLWSPKEVTDTASMYDRMHLVSRRLEWLGLTHDSNYEPMLRRIAGSDNIEALRTIGNVVEPVKDYSREETAATTPNSGDPLNRLVDTVRSESDTARHFAEYVDLFLAGKSKSTNESKIRECLVQWRDQAPAMEKLPPNPLLIEVIPVSQNLAEAAQTGLAALDYMDKGQPAPEAWKTAELAVIERAAKPEAQLLIMVAPTIQKLIEAAAGQASKAQ